MTRQWGGGHRPGGRHHMGFEAGRHPRKEIAEKGVGVFNARGRRGARHRGRGRRR